MQPYQIGDYVFFARNFLDATFDAIERARAMFRAGDISEANALFQEAMTLRRMVEATPRTSMRAHSHFNRAHA
jgi:hypothetical protein